MANSSKLGFVDVAKLIEVSGNEKENVSDYEYHSKDKIKSNSSDNDFDIDIQKMHNIQNTQSKNREICWKLNTIPHSTQSAFANIIK
ncbi:hypothetical protein NPIL_573471 [Nephila pilipes]|uniref:Uncharacterized protein n=1 Tax=Nephila pilipes TaxID=299642 RepID=A0A8X6N2T2_NEPPI|nr:hypothetical protein NPIL_573471 [Nephila pilipes]